MQKANRTQQKRSLVYKPYLKGNWASRLAARRGLKILGYQGIFVFFYIFVGQALMFDSLPLRLVTNVLILAALGGLLYMDGMKTGEEDVAYGEIAYTRQESGQIIPKEERDRCFHPVKGVFTVLMGMLPLVLIGIALALTAQPLRHHLGALPSWLEGYRTRADIGLALSYYNETTGMGVVDVLRIIVRLLLFPFVNIVGTDSPSGLLWLERLSPLLILLVPMAYAYGYSLGRKARAMVHGSIADDQKRRVRRERKERKRRREKEPTQLV